MPARQVIIAGKPAAGHRVVRATAAALAFAVAAAFGGSARAQNISNEVSARDSTFAYGINLKTWDSIKLYGAETVSERDRKPWLPDGLHIGSFIVYPSISTKTILDDNVYASATNRKSDLIQQVETSVRIGTDMPRHAFDFAFGGRFSKYMEHEDFDHFDANAAFNASFQVDHATQLAITLRTALDHLDRLQPDEPRNAREPTEILHNRAAISLKRDAGRLWGSVGGAIDTWTYGNVHAFDGSLINQGDRDLRMVSGHTIAGYRFSPGYDLVAKLRVLRQETPGTTTIKQDAWGYEGAAGLKAEINPLLRWHMFGGWGVREFDDPSRNPVNTVVGEAGITWLPTQLMTVYFTAARSITDNSGADAGTVFNADTGRIDNLLRAKVEYEALRNLVFTLQGEYHQLEYPDATRRDQLYVGKAGIDYLHTKNTALSLSYEHQYRQSNVDEDKLSRNRFWLEGKLRF